jgi:hypothetical protein
MDFRFRVRGVVRGRRTRRPLGGLVVRSFDKDLMFDDPLAQTRTSKNGSFELVYTDDTFRSMFDEQPDLYLRVLDADCKTELATTRDAIRWNAGADETFDIDIEIEDR